MTVLLNATNSPRLRRHFKADFSIQTVGPIGPIAALLLSTINGWENVAFKALEEINRGKLERGEIEWEAVASKVRADAQRINSRATPPQHFVLCECVLLSYMLSQEELFAQLFWIIEIVLSRVLPPHSIYQLCKRNQVCHQRVATTSDATHGDSHGCRKLTKNVVVKLLYTPIQQLYSAISTPGFGPRQKEIISIG